MRTSYDAAVEVATRSAFPVVPVPPALAGYELTMGTSPRGWVEVRVSLAAPGLPQACATAVAIASAATGAEAITCQVMTEEEAEERRFSRSS